MDKDDKDMLGESRSGRTHCQQQNGAWEAIGFEIDEIEAEEDALAQRDAKDELEKVV